MSGYVINFTVYTMAMIGLICFAVFVYKKVMCGSLHNKSSKFLSVEESMNLSPRKTLHVVRAGNEKFLIASDAERTTLISKLGCQNYNCEGIEIPNFPNYLSSPEENENKIQETISPAQSPKQDQIQTSKPKRVSAQDKKPAETIAITAHRPVRRKDKASEVINFSQKKTTSEKSKSPMMEMAKRINEL